MKSIQIENDLHKRLKILSACTEKQVKNLLIEAVTLLFDKYEKEINNGVKPN